MATGPEHYTRAEQLLAIAAIADPPQSAYDGDPELLIAAAAVHAALANAAATALAQHNTEFGSPLADKDAWYRAASEGPGERARRKAADRADAAGFQEGPAS
jgi:hypothetical protein